MVSRLAVNNPATVLDIGCGWGELMLLLLEDMPSATGVGIDLNADDLGRGRRNAAALGFSDRVKFIEESARGTSRGPADMVLCIGASHALSDAAPPGHTVDALRALRGLVNPGGRVLLGEAFWERPPSDAELAAMWPGTGADEMRDLAGLAGAAIAAGFRLAWLETANSDEWEEFESGYQADVEEWLATYPGHPLAGQTRQESDTHRSHWLRGYRGLLGMAYLTLIPVAAAEDEVLH
jgi:SAM-dependent methyltransferase